MPSKTTSLSEEASQIIDEILALVAASTQDGIPVSRLMDPKPGVVAIKNRRYLAIALCTLIPGVTEDHLKGKLGLRVATIADAAEHLPNMLKVPDLRSLACLVMQKVGLKPSERLARLIPGLSDCCRDKAPQNVYRVRHDAEERVLAVLDDMVRLAALPEWLVLIPQEREGVSRQLTRVRQTAFALAVLAATKDFDLGNMCEAIAYVSWRIGVEKAFVAKALKEVPVVLRSGDARIRHFVRVFQGRGLKLPTVWINAMSDE